MLETVPLRVFVRWTVFAVSALVVMVPLGFDLPGLIPVEVALVLLIVFRPPEVHVSDAELYEWLNRA